MTNNHNLASQSPDGANRRVAIVELTDQQLEAAPSQFSRVKLVELYAVHPDQFVPVFNQGQRAAWALEHLCAHLFSVLQENQLIGEAGWQFDRYDLGSVARFAKQYKPELLPVIEKKAGRLGAMGAETLIDTLAREQGGAEVEADFAMIVARLQAIYTELRPFILADPERNRLLAGQLPETILTGF